MNRLKSELKRLSDQQLRRLYRIAAEDINGRWHGSTYDAIVQEMAERFEQVVSAEDLNGTPAYADPGQINADDPHEVTSRELRVVTEAYRPSTASGHEPDSPDDVYAEFSEKVDFHEFGGDDIDFAPTFECTCGTEFDSWDEVEAHYRAVVQAKDIVTEA